MKSIKLAAMPLGMLCLLSACVDDNYDLSDIDTNVELKVTDLTVPVNIDPIQLKNVFDIKEGDRIQVVDGRYAVVETGDFDTDEITIDKICIDAPFIKSSSQQLFEKAPGMKKARANGKEVVFAVSSPLSDYRYNTSDVSEYIISIDEVGTHFTFDIYMRFPGVSKAGDKVELRNVELQIPAGLSVTDLHDKYDSATGVYTVASLPLKGDDATVHIEASAINAAKAGIEFDYDSHTINFGGKVGILSGDLHISNVADVPNSLMMYVDYDMSEIEATFFSGEMDYEIDNTSFTDVELGELPDFLSQEGTDIRIVNPQLYLDIYNPLYNYSLYADTGLEIKSFGRDGTDNIYSLDNGTFRVRGDSSDPYVRFCLSPMQPAKPYEGFEGAEHVPFSGLSDVLSGNGIPERLSVDLVDPRVPRQKVKDLRLGVNLGKVHGKYTFFAPLNLEAGSTVVYSEREDGWNDEDIDALTIQTLEVRVNVTTDIPLALKLTGYPVDKQGHRINNVDIVGGDVQANAQAQEVTLRITGEIRHLDGIEFMALATAAASGQELKPDMKITLANLRAKVSGKYNKEL